MPVLGAKVIEPVVQGREDEPDCEDERDDEDERQL